MNPSRSPTVPSSSLQSREKGRQKRSSVHTVNRHREDYSGTGTEDNRGTRPYGSTKRNDELGILFVRDQPKEFEQGVEIFIGEISLGFLVTST